MFTSVQIADENAEWEASIKSQPISGSLGILFCWFALKFLFWDVDVSFFGIELSHFADGTDSDAVDFVAQTVESDQVSFNFLLVELNLLIWEFISDNHPVLPVPRAGVVVLDLLWRHVLGDRVVLLVDQEVAQGSVFVVVEKGYGKTYLAGFLRESVFCRLDVDEFGGADATSALYSDHFGNSFIKGSENSL